MSTSLAQIAQRITTYMGMTTVITGVLGNLLNIVIFLSLKTFRQSSCAFYLTVISFVNIGQLITGQLSRVVITGFRYDLTQASLFYCKCRWYMVYVCSYISSTCLCLAIIDQFFATSARVYWQQWSSIKSTKRLSIISIVFWLIYTIPYLIFYTHNISSTTGGVTCSATNLYFRQYHAYMNGIVLYSGLPIGITILFGSLVFRNIRGMSYRTVPLIRRELDKQLTNMVLVQIIFGVLFNLPYLISTVINLIPSIINTSDGSSRVSFALGVTACIYYLNFACPFYVYMIVSDRFRQQFFYVFCRRHCNQCRRNQPQLNQITPQSIET